MIEKYHVQIGFKACHVDEARRLIEFLKDVRLSFTSHALIELGRESEAVRIGQALRDYRLNFSDVFELAFIAGRLEKLGFRIKYGENDIIFILSREKAVITCWTNSKKDLHFTLKTWLYCKPCN